MSIAAWLMQPPWLPVDPPLRGNEDERSAHLLVDIVDQFDVEFAPRYQKTADGRTWCKTFLWDVLSALGCGEVAAHWVDRSGVPTLPGKGWETRANDIVVRLSHRLYSWREVSAAEAHANADAGRPTCCGWFNRSGPGHVAVVMPGGLIAQAGAENFVGRDVRAGFGGRPVSYFIHP